MVFDRPVQGYEAPKAQAPVTTIKSRTSAHQQPPPPQPCLVISSAAEQKHGELG